MPDTLSPSRQELESRRLAAARLLLDGARQADITRIFGVTRTCASRWARALKRDGIVKLYGRRAPGRPCRLTNAQRAELVHVYFLGPKASGWEKWTGETFASVVHQRTGILYNRDHIYRLMTSLGLRKKRQRRPEIQPRRPRAEVVNA